MTDNTIIHSKRSSMLDIQAEIKATRVSKLLKYTHERVAMGYLRRTQQETLNTKRAELIMQ